VKTLWLIIAAVCGLVATWLMIQRDVDKAFVVAAIGAVCWFLSYRVQMKQLVGATTNSEEDEESAELDEGQI
jgi:predicted membrane metal-binding protein